MLVEGFTSFYEKILNVPLNYCLSTKPKPIWKCKEYAALHYVIPYQFNLKQKFKPQCVLFTGFWYERTEETRIFEHSGSYSVEETCAQTIP